MLAKDENELLTRVTGDAPAGQMLRRYWLPACWSAEAGDAGAAPQHVRMFGEDFVAERRSGRVRFADRAGRRSYPARDAGGLVWVYLGPPEREPAFPAYDWTAMPRDHVALMKYVERANWLQCAEGTIDTTHSWFLHSGAVADWKLRTSVSLDFSPRLETEDTPYGFRYAAIRTPNTDPETTKYVKITLYAFPSTGIIARPMDDSLATLVQIFVPIDDEQTMVFSMMHSFNGKPLDEAAIRESLHLRPGIDLDENWRPRFCTADGWTQDRVAMKNASYTGIEGFPNQDIAVQESMGRIVDRTQEHLGTSDIAIIRMRKRMLESVRRFIAGGTPVGLDAEIAYGKLWAEQAVVPIERPWQSVGPPETHAKPAVRV